MIAVEKEFNDLRDMEAEAGSSGSEEKRFIYFNPNFCINNINVKELVLRAEQAALVSTAPGQSNLTTILHESGNQSNALIASSALPVFSPVSAEKNPAPVQPGPSDDRPTQRPALLPTPSHNPFKVPPPKQNKQFKRQRGVAAPGWIRDKPFFVTDIDWNDREHPWYHHDPNYVSNLLNLAADYTRRPNQLPRCRMPPLSKRELLFRMEKVHKNGKLLSSLHLPSAVEKFIRYMRLIKDQIDFDMLRIDYSNNQSYAECRRKRAMMKELGVNKFHYVNEEAVEELFARNQNLKGFKKEIRRDLDLSTLDTSKLSSAQRKFLFKHHVFNQGKRFYINKDKDKDSKEKATPASPNLVAVNKFKAVSKQSLAPSTKNKVRSTLRYRREEPSLQDCRFFLKTGRCKFGVRCIRKHDPSKLPAKLKKAAARKRPKSTFSVNNVPRRPVNNVSRRSVNNVSRPPQSSMPPPLVPISSLKLTKPQVVQTPSTPQCSTAAQQMSAATTSSKQSSSSAVTSQSVGPALFKSDYRFINNPKLGPTKTGLNKKLVNRALKWKRKTAIRRKQDCMFFIRRGKCVFGDECRKRHDPAKVALCSRFIFYNRCSNSPCPFQHKVNCRHSGNIHEARPGSRTSTQTSTQTSSRTSTQTSTRTSSRTST
jgi:hypothetical protein